MRLFELANKIIDPQNLDTIHEHVMALLKYVHEHFRDEEAIIREILYPRYEQHRLEHDKLLGRLSVVDGAVGRGEIDSDYRQFYSRLAAGVCYWRRYANQCLSEKTAHMKINLKPPNLTYCLSLKNKK